MENDIEKPDENDEPAFAHILIPGTMSGVEMIEFWEHNGVFNVSWPQYDEIGKGKKYGDSTEYVNAKRALAERHIR